jgi:hypothetical protein
VPPKRARGRNLNEVLAERRARSRSRLRAVLLAASALAIVAVLLRAWLEQRSRPAFELNRVVVVPLENRTGDPAFDKLGVVASDWITRVLSGYAPAREVVPTTTALAYQRSARLARYDLETRARELAHGTRAHIVVWGTFYQTGDTLRFNVEINDLKTSLMVGSLPQIAVPAGVVMQGIDRLRNVVVRQLLAGGWYNRPKPRPVPNRFAYEAFVSGLEHFVERRYADAANDFTLAARQDTISYLPHQVWLLDALLEAHAFSRADSAARSLVRRRVTTRADEARAMHALARLRGNPGDMLDWSSILASRNPADDLAQYQNALDALALGRVREARRIFGELHPNQGALHGRPDVYLHHAAVYHLLRNHPQELRVVRAGLLARNRTLDVRLANCRVRAALGEPADAQAALHAIVANDTDTSSTLTIGMALDDCAAELEAHGLADVATRAQQLAHEWRTWHPQPRAIVPDPAYEQGEVEYEQARASAERGDAGAALNMLYESFLDGMPYYEAGRLMLHAEPAFRRLRRTRGFIRINEPQG